MQTAAKVGVAHDAHREYLRELLWNQIWQSVNFLSKALFLLLLTPLMIKRWGTDGYGLFGLSSSLLVSMALADGGVRSLTRLRLTEALRQSDEPAFRRALGEGLVTFGSVLGLIILATIGLAATGWMQTAFKLPPEGSLVLVATVILTGLSLTSLLALEPLAARGKLSEVKAAGTWGALVAIPICGATLWLNGSVLVVAILYSLCMTTPNLILIVRSRIWSQLPAWREGCYTPRVIFRTLRSGGWYYATTIALVVKTHALTFLVSAFAGPTEAGIFYFILRFTEIIGSVGATASDTSLASLAATENADERRKKFNHSWLYVVLFCLPGALIFGFQGNWIVKLWFSHENIGWTMGLGMAVFGLAGAFSRVVVNAAMGLRLIKVAAISNLAEAGVNLIGAVVGYKLAGVPGVLLGGSAGIIAMLIPARKIAAFCGESFSSAYIQPVSGLALGMTLIAVTQAGAALTPVTLVKFAVVGLAGIIALFQLRSLHR